MAKFEKGQTGNPDGRPSGVPNKLTANTKIVIQKFIESKTDELDTIWEGLKPKEKADLMVRLLDYIVPKLRSVELSGGISQILNESEKEEIIKSLKNENHDQ